MVFLQRIFKERGWRQFEEPTPVLTLPETVLDYEYPDGSTIIDNNDEYLSIYELVNEKTKLVPVPSRLSTCSEYVK